MDAGKRSHALLDFFATGLAQLIGFVIGALQRHVGGDQSIDAPARVQVRKTLQAPQEQAGASKQDQRECDLADDQRMAQAML